MGNQTTQTRIAINALPLLSPLTGVGHYIDQLIRCFRSLSPSYEYIYYYGYFTRKVLHGDDRTYRLKDFLFKIPGFKKGLRSAIDAFAKSDRVGFDLYFEPNFIPLKIKAKSTVTTVHDFSFRLFPETHPADRVRYFDKHFLPNIRNSSKIITVSNYVKLEATDLFGIAAESITPIHLGVNHSLFKRYPQEAQEACRLELGLPEKFILFVGTREPRKNLSRLVGAYAELPGFVQGEFSLVIVGPRGWGESDLHGGKNLGNRVMVLQYLSPQMLALTYNLASALAYPSLYEGFGLPPLEAMACGCPVIASRIASLPEVCEDAAYYINPTDTQDIADGINNVLCDNELRSSLVEKGFARAKLFTWEKTAKRTLEVFHQVLSEAG